MTNETWKQCRLWGTIDAKRNAGDPSAQKVALFLEASMPDIVTILNKGGVGPGLSDFTLHDADHSARVVRWMERLTPDETFNRLSVYELGLLLLSAYLHDIGMSPGIGQVWRHFNYLLSGNTVGAHISEVDAAAMAKWLAGFDATYTIPLTPDQLQDHDQVTDCAAFLTAYYCRDRHNDWSGVWIRTNLTGKQPYPTWIVDLTQLCQSHHWSRKGLDVLDLRHVPGSSEPVNLRYLSMLLRVADVIEVDPERVPECIRNHREVSHTSADYWLKDLWPSVNIESTQGGRIIRFEAWPPKARLHHALDQTADQIDAELAMARTLADEGWFAKGSVSEAERCKWDLPYRVHRRIEAQTNTYEYINGSFRPNTKKVLEILSGTNLYGDRFAAVRELVQNAFDAVRWCVADRLLKEVERDGTVDREAARLRLGENHLVSLSLEEDKTSGRWWLVCTDDGRGMTKRVIESQMLISGNSQRGELKTLEARCQKAGFSSEVTAQFGIGVLSYFMLADRIEVTTKRRGGDPEAGDAGWHFETDGIGTFGELRKVTCDEGTTVRLRLKDRDAKALSAAIRTALVEEVVYSPCRLDYVGVDGERLSLKPGWTRGLEYYVKDLVEKFDSEEDFYFNEFVSTERRARNRAIEALYARWHQEDCQRVILQFQETGPLTAADGTIVGRYRILTPCFQFPEGRSLASPHLDAEEFSLARCRGMGISCWKGIHAQLQGHTWEDGDFWKSSALHGQVLEIDLTDGNSGKILVDRNKIVVTEVTVAILDAIERRCAETAANAVAAMQDSPYAEISRAPRENNGLTAPPMPDLKPGAWWGYRQDGRLRFGHLPFPVAPAIDMHDAALEWCGKAVTPIPSVGLDTHWAEGYPPSRLVAVRRGKTVHPVRLWEGVPQARVALEAVAFPPEWNDILLFAHRTTIFNTDHPLIRALPPEVAAEIANQLYVEQDANDIAALLGDRHQIITIALRWLGRNNWENFATLSEEEPEVAAEFWQVLTAGQTIPLRIAEDGKVVELHLDEDATIVGQLPMPKAPEWRLKVVEVEPVNADE